ncbi:hypothetical protein [Escherichia coli]|uniref:hypothetical protein n=1 Tax=Escherichia coli TaxID=562 RepID=UPI0037DC8A3E
MFTFIKLQGFSKPPVILPDDDSPFQELLFQTPPPGNFGERILKKMVEGGREIF